MATRTKSTPKAEVTPEAAPEVPAEEVTLMGTAELADLFGTDAKTLRRFLRANLAPTSLPGKGGRYRIPTASLEALKTRFAEKSSQRATPIIFKTDEVTTD